MNIIKLVLGACSTNVYIVSSNKKNAILIDPADNATEIIKTIEENDNIFSGDTLMFEKHGKTSLPGGNEKSLISSIEKMMNTLIGDYKIYPGHRQETSLDYERKCRLSTVITGY